MVGRLCDPDENIGETVEKLTAKMRYPGHIPYQCMIGEVLTLFMRRYSLIYRDPMCLKGYKTGETSYGS
ncbi:MAG: hypothetical protein IH955_07950 [Chloroflexi bacterium]|nr:hypothetical protein [Chloroflexota bacterium]